VRRQPAPVQVMAEVCFNSKPNYGMDILRGPCRRCPMAAVHPRLSPQPSTDPDQGGEANRFRPGTGPDGPLRAKTFPLTFLRRRSLNLLRGLNVRVMDGACLEFAGKASAQPSTMSEAEELSLIRRAQEGDRSAFDALIRLYDKNVLHLALQIVGSPEEARDLYQEAFLKVYRSIHNFRLEAKFSTWLYRVVMNVCLDHLRRQKTRKEVSPPQPEEGEPEFLQTVADERPTLDPERAVHSKEISQRIQAAIERLNPRERMVFELKHYQGLKLRAIGEICHTSEQTAKNCLFRATQKLRTELNDLA
jgi:RNA polymerase sigma-70 factor, ECF subfamily